MLSYKLQNMYISSVIIIISSSYSSKSCLIVFLPTFFLQIFLQKFLYNLFVLVVAKKAYFGGIILSNVSFNDILEGKCC